MSRLARLARTFRTLRHLGQDQLVAQVIHGLRGIRGPASRVRSAPARSEGASTLAFLPAPRHVGWHPTGELELLHHRADFADKVDWEYEPGGPLWLYHLHQFDHLRAPGLTPDRRLALMLDWVRRHEEGSGWDPHPTSLRILNWGKILLTQDAVSPAGDEVTELHASLARQADTLARNLELRLQANHLLSNLIGLVFAGLLFADEGADDWLAHSGHLCAELDAQFAADGAHQERSPMYHSLLLENLLDLLNLARARASRAPAGLVEVLEETTGRGLGALEVWCHPDGEIPLFGDSAFGIAQRPDALLEYASSLGLAPRGPDVPGLLADTGFARLDAGVFSVVVSVAGPAPGHQPGHAHCDALAFELSCGGERVVCDTGVHDYLLGERRARSRATRSHATMEVGGAEQAEIWASHRVGGRPRVELVGFEPGQGLEATCASWSTLDSPHRRRFAFRSGGLEVRDVLEGLPRPVYLALPLAPGIDVRLVHDAGSGDEAHLVLPGGGRMRVALPIAASWRIESAPYFPEFGLEEQRVSLVGEAVLFESGTWRFDLLE